MIGQFDRRSAARGGRGQDPGVNRCLPPSLGLSANIVLVADGWVKVLDFGIARAEGTTGTRTLGMLGTAT